MKTKTKIKQSFDKGSSSYESNCDIQRLICHQLVNFFFEKKENVLILRIIPIRDNYGKKSFIYSLVTFFLSYLVIYVVTFFYGILGGKIFHFTPSIFL